MGNTTLNSRISLRYDTYDQWNTPSGESVVLNKGEVGICAISVNGADQPTIMFKVGNGISTFRELPWTSGLAADVFDWAKAAQLVIIDNDEGEIITNIAWDEANGGIKISRKTLMATIESFATQGMIASHANGTLVFTNAVEKDAIVSVKFI